MSPIPCPACGVPLPPSPSACPACHLPLTGPDAARLWQVDQDLAALQAERRGLLVSLRSQPQTTDPRPDTPADLPLAGPQPAPRRSWTTQQTLLGVGVLLVLVAASIALAVAWFVIGRYGQMVVMGGFTVLAAYVALYLSRRGLPSTAEALALVAGGLMLLDVAAARRFGLLGLDRLDGRGYTAVAGLVVAVVLALLHRRDRRIAGFALLSLTAASIGWAGIVALGDRVDAVAAGLALVGAVVFGLLHLVLPADLGLTRRAATGPAAAWSAVSLVLAATGAAQEAERPGSVLSVNGVACVALLVLLCVAGALTVRRVVHTRAARLGSRAALRSDWAGRVVSGDWRAAGVVSVVATAAMPAAVLTLGAQLGATRAAILAVPVALVAVALLVLRPAGRSLGQWWLDAQAAAAPVMLVVVTATTGARVPSLTALALLALVAAAAAVVRPVLRAPASGVAAGAGLAAVALAGDLASAQVQTLAVTAFALALTVVALARPARAEEVPVALVGGLGFLGALARSLDLAGGYTVTVLTAVTISAIAAAVLRRPVRPVAAAVAAMSGTSALWLAGGLVSPETQWALLALCVGLLVGLALWLRRTVEEVVLGAAAVVVAVAAFLVALDRGWPHAAAGAAAAYGLLAVGYAALPHRRALVSLGVLGLVTGTWVELAHANVDTVEAYTLPLAALLLAAGLWSHRELHDHSWLTVGPALVVALIPSALLTAGGEGLARPLLTVSAGAVVLVVGAWRRWQAMVVVGAVAAAVVAVTQLGPYTLQAPRYLTLGALGVALLLIGARYEQRRANARHAISWLASMS